MSGFLSSLRELLKVDRRAFSISIGLRAGSFVVIPMLVGIATGQRALVYSSLGALFVINTEGPNTVFTSFRVLLLAAIIEPVAFGLGTLAGTTGLFSIPLMGIGVFLALLLSVLPDWTFLAMFTAIFFAVGVGLPGGSIPMAGVRVAFAVLGSLWAIAGVALHRFVESRRSRRRRGNQPQSDPSTDSRPAASPSRLRFAPLPRPLFTEENPFGHAIIVGVASSLGIAVGLSLGLPRDFWIVVTLILALRPGLGATRSYATLIILGTAFGAVLAAIVTLTISNDYVLWIFLLLFAVAQYATRGANLGLTQLLFTPLVIILLNILYSGQWELALVRVLDVTIGGAIAVFMVYVIESRRWTEKGGPHFEKLRTNR